MQSATPFDTILIQNVKKRDEEGTGRPTSIKGGMESHDRRQSGVRQCRDIRQRGRGRERRSRSSAFPVAGDSHDDDNAGECLENRITATASKSGIRISRIVFRNNARARLIEERLGWELLVPSGKE